MIYGIGILTNDKKAELLLNFRASAKDSIRQSANLAQWVTALSNLKTHGVSNDDVKGVVSRWNKDCPNNQKLTGQRAVALQLMMEKMPQSTLDSIVQHVSEFSWSGGMLLDDTFASKKIQMGLAFRDAVTFVTNTPPLPSHKGRGA